METTITQNGALFAIQHKSIKRCARAGAKSNAAQEGFVTPRLRTSVGEFAFRRTRLGCHLDLIVGNVRRVLGLYGTREAAVRALKDRKTGFTTWDKLDRRAVASQTAPLQSQR